MMPFHDLKKLWQVLVVVVMNLMDDVMLWRVVRKRRSPSNTPVMAMMPRGRTNTNGGTMEENEAPPPALFSHHRGLSIAINPKNIVPVLKDEIWP